MIRAIVDFALSHRLMMLAFGIFLFGMGGKFVNGLLDRVKKDLLRPARQAAG